MNSPSPFASYEDFDNEVDRLYKEKNLNKAILLLSQNLEKYPNHEYEMFQTLGYFLTFTCQYHKAIEIWKQGLDKGYFFGFRKESPLFKPYFDIPEFSAIYEENNKRIEEIQKTTTTQYKIILPESYNTEKNYPLFIILHGGGDNIKGCEKYWRSTLLRKNYIKLFFQSSQVQGMNAYGWIDLNKAAQDITSTIHDIKQKYNVSIPKSIIGGISAGGKMALYSIVNQIIPIHNFFLMVPVIYPSFEKDLNQCSSVRALRGYMITGKKDTNYYSQQQELMAIFENSEIKVKIKEYDNLGHFYSPDFSLDLDNAIRFFTSP